MPDDTPVQFTKSSARRIGSVVRYVEKTPRFRAKTKQRDHRPIPDDKFLAKITGNASLATNRWKYAWTEVLLNGDVVADRSGGRSGTTSSGYAVNTAEMYHTSTYAWGVDITGTDYDATTSFAPRPIGGGGTADTHRYNVIVEMTQTVDINGAVKYWFTMMGSHDGAC